MRIGLHSSCLFSACFGGDGGLNATFLCFIVTSPVADAGGAGGAGGPGGAGALSGIVSSGLESSGGK